ncbi:MAG: asparagine synthase (glutamine-hydrolyzing) [Desulfovibrionaceae bacterium]
MCGICGYALHDYSPPPSCVEAMCQQLQRRGPDSHGLYCAPGIGLGHTRLEVIDLSTGGQPMHDATGRYTLVFNGEIYNYRHIRQELEQEGHTFVTTSDTEVLLQACIHWGEAALPKLNGMFAFALWDARAQCLLLARDRLGVKPLYWALSPQGGLLFASEVSSLVASGLLPQNGASGPHQGALQSYLSVGYVIGEQSIREGVQRLRPGHTLHFQRGTVRQSCWWDLAEQWKNAPRLNLSPEEYSENFQALLDDSVNIRLKSDVPLGAFLSGGVDSSAIVASMRQSVADVFTFTMAFADAAYNEGPQAARVAQFLGTRHFEALADLNSTDVLHDLAAHLDEPFADTSVIPTYILCKMAKQHITVALSGDGGDELLGGYITLHADSLFPLLQRVPRPFMACVACLVDRLPDIRGKISFTYKLKQFISAYPLSPPDAHAWWRMLFSGEQIARMLPGTPSPASLVEQMFAPFRAAWKASEGLSLQDRLLFMDYKTWLVDDILFKTDRASMQHGLEVRSPFLDYRLVEYCASVPAALKRQGRNGKILLKKTTAQRIPTQILEAPKRGFNAPVSRWLCEDWRPVAEDVFSAPSLLACGLNPTATRGYWQEHATHKRDHGFRLFTLLMYVLWARQHGYGGVV